MKNRIPACPVAAAAMFCPNPQFGLGRRSRRVHRARGDIDPLQNGGIGWNHERLQFPPPFKRDSQHLFTGQAEMKFPILSDLVA